MNKSVLFIICFILHFSFVFCQKDEEQLQNLEITSDSIYYGASDYYKEDDYTKLQEFRNQILSKFTDTTNSGYKKALSKKYASDALLLNHLMKHDAAILASKKALDLAENLKKRNLLFEGHIHQNLYQQYYNNLDWNNALHHAKKAKDVFKDTLTYNHLNIAKAEFSIGYVYSRLEDINKVIEQYEKTVELIISDQGEFNKDAAYYEHHLALVYGFVGYYNKELKSYEKVIKRWEAIENSEMDMSYLSIAYGSVAIWYMDHGDYDMAEKYLIKQENLVKKYQKYTEKWFNETFKGRTQVVLWANRAKLALNKKDTLTATNYNTKVLNFVNNFDFDDPKNNPQNLSYAFNFVTLNEIRALTLRANIIKNEKPFQALKLFSQALDLEKEDDVSVTTLDIKRNLSQLYKNNNNYGAISKKLDNWLILAHQKKATYLKLFLLAEKANLAFLQNDIELMNTKYEAAFKKAQQDTLKAIPLETLTFKDSKPYSEQRYVDLILKATSDYQGAYTKTNQKKYLKIAHNLSLLASDIFSNSYLFSEFNDNIYETRLRINQLLLSTSIQLKDKVDLDEIVSILEESSSKTHWKKFLSSTEKKYLNIPDSILELESNLKNELHFYKKKDIASAELEDQARRTIKEKTFNIEKKLRELEQSYQENYPSYYNQTQKTFDLGYIKKELSDKQTILKYVYTSKKIYVFAINKNSTQLYEIGSNSKNLLKLKTFIASLSKPNLNYTPLASELYTLFIPKKLDLVTNQELVFILDDILNY